MQPALLLADEPTGNLDSVTAAEILQLLTDVQQRFATTLIIATHDAGIAASCDEVLEVRDGQVHLQVVDVPARRG